MLGRRGMFIFENSEPVSVWQSVRLQLVSARGIRHSPRSDLAAMAVSVDLQFSLIPVIVESRFCTGVIKQISHPRRVGRAIIMSASSGVKRFAGCCSVMDVTYARGFLMYRKPVSGSLFCGGSSVTMSARPEVVRHIEAAFSSAACRRLLASPAASESLGFACPIHGNLRESAP